MKHKILLSILAILLALPVFSAPARKGVIYLSQPDGTAFRARMYGDEFMKITTTAEGYAVTQDKDGWWCYAYYDAEGVKTSSGHRVGTDVPSGIKEASISIPYGRLAENAGRKRMSMRKEDVPIMSRILAQSGADTKRGTATKHGLIILAQFSDIKFTHKQEDFISMLTRPGYDRNGATGSAKEYFDAQFNGAIDFSFDVSRIVTLPYSAAHYGGNGEDGTDKSPELMVIDACTLADSEVDFARYDDDGDGVVDNVFIFFAGGDEAEGAGEDRIWSHAWHVYSGAGKNLTLDGRRIDRYACTAELSRRYSENGSYRDVLAGIGTFCHEYFHTFGIPDMYDTDYEESGGRAAGLWGWTSLMDSGNQNNYGNTPPYLNAVEREYLGIAQPVMITKDGGYSLEPVHLNGRFYRMDTDYKDEYYLLEYRSGEGWDKYIGGSGMLVYHIDKSDRSTGRSDSYGMDITARERWMGYNEVNSRPDRQCADLIEADSRRDGFSATEDEAFSTSLGNIRGIFFPSGSVNSLLPGKNPGISYWSGKATEVSVTNIRETGDGMSFNVIGYSDTELPPEVASINVEPFMDAAIVLFESDREFEGEATVTWGRTGSETKTVKVKPYAPGRYSVTLEKLQPNNRTYTVGIHFELSGIAGDEASASFMTKKTPAVSWPFIYMNEASRSGDGTLAAGGRLPLRVYNSAGAAEITWTFDGEAVTVSGDGYYYPGKSGVLKAHITWRDGSEEIIMKEITIGKEVRK